jgi:hypothetical protein
VNTLVIFTITLAGPAHELEALITANSSALMRSRTWPAADRSD